MDEKLLTNCEKLSETYNSGDLDICIGLAKEMLRSDPNQITPLLYTARVHTQRRETALAKPYWHRLTMLAPQKPEPFLQSARICRLEKDWAACAPYIEEFIRQRPDHPEALGIQIQCFIHNDNSEKIGQALVDLCRLKPQAVASLALLAVEHGLGMDVAKALSDAAKTDDTIKALCNKLARSARDAAIGFEIQKDLLSASNCYQAMQVYTPESNYPTAALSRLCTPFLKKARAAYKEKNLEAAIKHANSCIALSPAEAEAYIIAGRSCVQRGNYQDAFDIFSTEIEQLWDNSWLLLNYARAAWQLKKAESAFAAFNAVKKRDDEKSSAFHAECDTRLDQLSEMAAQEVQDLLDKHEISRACTKIVEFQKMGRPLKNHAQLLEAIRKSGESKLNALCEAGDAEALDYAKNLVQLDRSAKFAYPVAGRLLMENRLYAEAHYYWAQLEKQEDTSPEALLNLARCYAKLNNKDEAMGAISALLALDPAHEDGQNLRADIARMGTLNSEGLS